MVRTVLLGGNNMSQVDDAKYIFVIRMGPIETFFCTELVNCETESFTAYNSAQVNKQIADMNEKSIYVIKLRKDSLCDNGFSISIGDCCYVITKSLATGLPRDSVAIVTRVQQKQASN